MSAFEVSFNSPQCGFMSIGFAGSGGEFHTTTANRPHSTALADLIGILTEFLDGASGVRILKWNRNPEEFDFVFERFGEAISLKIVEYPNGDRDDGNEIVFEQWATLSEVCSAFLSTLKQLYADRETDEFEFNWHQPFPEADFLALEKRLA